MKAVTTESQPLPKLTKIQQEILKLLYNFRFLNLIPLHTSLIVHLDPLQQGSIAFWQSPP
jgi:hypothetical protein